MNSGATDAVAAANAQRLGACLSELGIEPGATLMVHASFRSLRPFEGGPPALLSALLDHLGPRGTLLAYVSWKHSPYEETLGGRMPSPERRAAWPRFELPHAEPFPEWGYLNSLICAHPDVLRSAHPDASFAAIGARAGGLVREHPLNSALGEGSPLERFIEARGSVLLLGAPLDALTVLHYAEAVARIPGKRRVRYCLPDAGGSWRMVEDWDSNGILDEYAEGGAAGMDAVECCARAYCALRRHAECRLGGALLRRFDARDLVDFGIAELERRHGKREL